VQHRLHGDVDRAARRIGGDDLALEVLDLLDRTVLEHHIFLGIVAFDAVLEFVANDAQVVQPGVADGDAERRIGEVGDVDFISGERGNHRRRADEVHRLHHVGLAEMLGEVLLLQPDRRPIARRHPAFADFQRVGVGRSR
jgi:hypothetical protein